MGIKNIVDKIDRRRRLIKHLNLIDIKNDYNNGDSAFGAPEHSLTLQSHTFGIENLQQYLTRMYRDDEYSKYGDPTVLIVSTLDTTDQSYETTGTYNHDFNKILRDQAYKLNLLDEYGDDAKYYTDEFINTSGAPLFAKNLLESMYNNELDKDRWVSDKGICSQYDNLLTKSFYKQLNIAVNDAPATEHTLYAMNAFKETVLTESGRMTEEGDAGDDRIPGLLETAKQSYYESMLSYYEMKNDSYDALDNTVSIKAAEELEIWLINDVEDYSSDYELTFDRLVDHSKMGYFFEHRLNYSTPDVSLARDKFVDESLNKTDNIKKSVKDYVDDNISTYEDIIDAVSQYPIKPGAADEQLMSLKDFIPSEYLSSGLHSDVTSDDVEVGYPDENENRSAVGSNSIDEPQLDTNEPETRLSQKFQTKRKTNENDGPDL